MNKTPLTKKGDYYIFKDSRITELNQYFLELASFFSKSDQYKQSFFSNAQELDYKPLTGKELFIFRKQHSHPQELASCEAMQSLFQSITIDLLEAFEKKMLWRPGLLQELFDPEILDKNKLTSSVLRLFHYKPNKDDTQLSADAHTDVGLLTIIPRSTATALEVYDYQNEQEWHNVEANLQPDECIVMIGELLGKLSNHQLNPTLHRVASLHQDRYSIVFQARAHLSKKIEHSDFENEATGTFTEPFSQSVQQFVFFHQYRTQSVNGLY